MNRSNKILKLAWFERVVFSLNKIKMSYECEKSIEYQLDRPLDELV